MTAQINFDPALGAAALAAFDKAPAGGVAYLSGRNLQAGLLSSLVSVEILAATSGIVPWFDAGNGEKGVAVLGGARDRLANAPEAVRTIYLAAHGAARQAQAHAREASSAVPFSQRADGALAQLQSAVGIGALPLAVVMVLTVLGVAAIVASAWFARGVAERIVQTHSDDLRASYAVDQAARIAAAQIAAGKPVDPGVFEVFKSAAKQEHAAPWSLPAWGVVGAGALLLGMFWQPVMSSLRRIAAVA